MAMIKTKRDWQEFWITHQNFEHGVYGPPNPSVLDHIRKITKNLVNPAVVDIACGDGRYVIPIAQMGCNVSAIDTSQVALDRMQERIHRTKVQDKISSEAADIFTLLAERRKYDIVVCSGLLEEIPMDTHERLVKGLQKWTTQGGLHTLRYVTEKRLTPASEPIYVVDHNKLVGLYKGWHIINADMEPALRQARVGRKLGGKTVNRYFKAAGIVAYL